MKCEFDPASNACKRCSRTSRSCVVIPRAQKVHSVDTKVAELENKIEALTQEIRASREGNVDNGDEEGVFGEGDGEENEDTNGVQMSSVGGLSSGGAVDQSALHSHGRKRRFLELQDTGNLYPYQNHMDPVSGPVVSETSLLPGAGSTKASELDVINRGIIGRTLADELSTLR